MKKNFVGPYFLCLLAKLIHETEKYAILLPHASPKIEQGKAKKSNKAADIILLEECEIDS